MATILIADDDIVARDVIETSLVAEGHEVIGVMDGREAIDAALEHHPDMIFLAAALPIFNGYETCEILRNDPEISATLPIILLTTLEVDVRMRDRVGATECFPKSHTSNELQDLLVTHLGPKANTRES